MLMKHLDPAVAGEPRRVFVYAATGARAGLGGLPMPSFESSAASRCETC